jgi:iron-siderophore transport system permease protein
MSTLALSAPTGRRLGIGAIVLIIAGLFVLLTLAAVAFGST